jgi:hypothetical protein
MRQHFMRLHEPSPTVSVETIKPTIDKSAPGKTRTQPLTPTKGAAILRWQRL